METESRVSSSQVLAKILAIYDLIDLLKGFSIEQYLRTCFLDRFRHFLLIAPERPTLLSRAASLDPRFIHQRVFERIEVIFQNPALFKHCIDSNVRFLKTIMARAPGSPLQADSSSFVLSSSSTPLEGSLEPSLRNLFDSFTTLSVGFVPPDDFSLICFWRDTLTRSNLSLTQRTAFFRLLELLFTPAASQTSVERVFSVANRVQSDPRRGNMMNETLCKQVFIQHILRRDKVEEYGELILLLREFFRSHPDSFSSTLNPPSPSCSSSSSQTYLQISD